MPKWAKQQVGQNVFLQPNLLYMCWIKYGFLRCANSTLYFDLHFAYSPNFFGIDVLFGRCVRLLFRKRWLRGHLSTHQVLYRTPFLSSCLWSHFATSLTFHAVSVIVSGVTDGCSALCCCSLPDIGFHVCIWEGGALSEQSNATKYILLHHCRL